MRKELIEKVNSLQTKEFKTKEQAKHYAHELHELLQEEENRIMEEKRKLDDELWELRHAESKAFDYYLNIKKENKEMERLMEIKKILEQNRDLYYIETTNRETGWVGCASFYTNGEAKIYVNEGDGSGKDDAGYTYDEFLQKYDYDLMKEYPDYTGAEEDE